MAKVKRELESPTPPPLPRQKRPRVSFSNILTDKENSTSSSRASLRISSHSDLTPVNATIAKLEAELAEVRQQRQDRTHTKSALDAQNSRIEALQLDLVNRNVADRRSESPRPAEDGPGVLTRVHAARTSAIRSSAFEADEGLSVMQNSNIILYNGMPMPTLVRDLLSLEVPELPDNPNEEFSYNFLKKALGGLSIGNGSYVVSTKKVRGAEAPLFPNLKSWTVISRTCDLLLPRFPTQHGARISSFMQYTNDEDPFPLFIRSGLGYRYYKEPSASDTISSSEMALVPRSVKEHHARLLS
ncbi:hypothetical protein BDZ45DRAFT_771007 [Acephala macrosclerotiorum]|nr:hypothetical protein BDZ45DRAFT_771007 [Acephala macrosclerotiorum]